MQGRSSRQSAPPVCRAACLASIVASRASATSMTARRDRPGRSRAHRVVLARSVLLSRRGWLALPSAAPRYLPRFVHAELAVCRRLTRPLPLGGQVRGRARASRPMAHYDEGNDRPRQRCRSGLYSSVQLRTPARYFGHVRRGTTKSSKTFGCLHAHECLDRLPEQVRLVHFWISHLQRFRIKLIIDSDCRSHGTFPAWEIKSFCGNREIPASRR